MRCDLRGVQLSLLAIHVPPSKMSLLIAASNESSGGGVFCLPPMAETWRGRAKGMARSCPNAVQ